MKIHDEIDDWAAGALCDALSPAEKKEFEQHLAECPRCRSLYEEDKKMNDLLGQTLPESRPDAGFEQRIITGFREKTARGNSIPWESPLRLLAWLARFRIAQAACAMLVLAALVKTGTVLTGERMPGGKVVGVNAYGLKHGVDTNGVVVARPAFWTDDATYKVDINTASEGTFWDSPAGTGSNVPTYEWGLQNRIAGAKNPAGDWDNGPSGNAAVSGSAFNPLADVADATFWNPYPPQPAQTALSSGIVSVGGSQPINGTNYYSRGIAQTSGTVTLGAGQTVTIAGTPQSNIGGFYSVGSGATLSRTVAVLNGANVYSGTTTITNGVLGISGNANVIGGLVSSGSTPLTSTVVPNAINQPIFDTRKVLAKNDDQKQGKIQDQEQRQEEHEGNLMGLWLDPTKSPQNQQVPNALVDSSKLIRNATLEFEVPSFEKAAGTIAAVSLEENAYIATNNSEKGSNGKLQGQIVVKVAPANLDRFILKLRALGDLKNQNVGTEDVTKDYYDTEARLRNAQHMEQRLTDMLKNNTGKVSDLLQVEKEIGRVREQIEKMQGQLKYYDALVQYATVTITLEEKDINQTAAYMLKENATLSLFTKDVEKAFADAKADAEGAKAQTLDSHMERDAAGRTYATLHLLIPPDASADAIAKLKLLGRVQNFNSQTQRIAREGGSENSDTAKVERDKVELSLTIQRDEENCVQATNIAVQTDRVEEQTAQIKQAAAAAGVEVKGADFNRTSNGVEISGMLLRMPMSKYAGFLEQIKALGKVKDFTVQRREDAAAAAADAPVEIGLRIYSQGNIVADNTGLWATVRHTLGQGVAALMWSIRMIGVSLAFLAPWLAALGLILWIVMRRRKKRSAS